MPVKGNGIFQLLGFIELLPKMALAHCVVGHFVDVQQGVLPVSKELGEVMTF